MTAHELFGRFSSGQASEVLEWFQANEKPAYKSCIGLLATRRKLRPVFVERKPRDERHVWMTTALSRPQNNDLATEMLQSWLFGQHKAMVISFLDTLQIPHDGQGIIETLPAEPSSEQLESAVQKLLEENPRLAVVVYLHLFTQMGISDWPHLAQLVATDPRFLPSTENP